MESTRRNAWLYARMDRAGLLFIPVTLEIWLQRILILCLPSTYEYDIEKAKALVEECGNTGAEVVIKSYNTEPYATLSVWLQSVLTNIGLDAKVETRNARHSWSSVTTEKLPFARSPGAIVLMISVRLLVST